jgi:hypothetical protein
MTTHYLIDSVGQFFFLIDFGSNLTSYIWFSILGVGIGPAIIGIFLVWLLTRSKSRKEQLI